MNALMMVLEIIVPLICFGLRLKGMQTTMTCHERIAGSSRELKDTQAHGRELMLLYKMIQSDDVAKFRDWEPFFDVQ